MDVRCPNENEKQNLQNSEFDINAGLYREFGPHIEHIRTTFSLESNII